MVNTPCCSPISHGQDDSEDLPVSHKTPQILVPWLLHAKSYDIDAWGFVRDRWSLEHGGIRYQHELVGIREIHHVGLSGWPANRAWNGGSEGPAGTLSFRVV